MAKIKQRITITEVEDRRIRRQWDIQRGRWYFSVTDVMAVLTESVDARNYWKALKNRLKNSHNQLVMDCNQLKMRANDGKLYLVDTADADTLIKIIQVVAPHNIPPFRSWFEHVEMENSLGGKNSEMENGDFHESPSKEEDATPKNESEISTGLEIPIDVFEKDNRFFVKLILPGFDPSTLLISTSMNTLTLKGTVPLHPESAKVAEENYLLKELSWGNFHREIKFESLVDVEQVEATEFHGLITIILNKIDLNKTRFIKVRSL